jgi:hypothetical protein
MWNISEYHSISSYNQPPGDLGESENGQSLWRKRLVNLVWYHGPHGDPISWKLLPILSCIEMYHGGHESRMKMVTDWQKLRFFPYDLYVFQPVDKSIRISETHLTVPAATRSFKSSSHNSGRHVPSSQTLKRMTCGLRKILGSGSAKLCLNHHESPPHRPGKNFALPTHTKIGGEWWQRTLDSGLSKSLLFGDLLCEGCASACFSSQFWLSKPQLLFLVCCIS